MSLPCLQTICQSLVRTSRQRCTLYAVRCTPVSNLTSLSLLSVAARGSASSKTIETRFWRILKKGLMLTRPNHSSALPSSSPALLSNVYSPGTNFLELSHLPTQLNATDLAAFSSTAAAAGMNVSIWIGVDSLSNNITAMKDAFRAMPALDSVFFPGTF